MIKNTIFIFLFAFVLNVNSQNVYNERIEGCDTERFTLESNKQIAKIEDSELKKFISKITSEEVRKKIRGKLKIQIIVYKDGTSCFISYENETNVKSSELEIQKFKSLVDSELIWENGVENVTAQIEIKFKKKKIELIRMGMNRTLGWHKLKQ